MQSFMFLFTVLGAIFVDGAKRGGGVGRSPQDNIETTIFNHFLGGGVGWGNASFGTAGAVRPLLHPQPFLPRSLSGHLLITWIF